jgi:hypothetical protein
MGQRKSWTLESTMGCRRSWRSARAAISLAASIAAWSGCGTTAPTDAGGESNAPYVPSVAQAESALRSVLEAWRQEVPPGLVPGTSPAVHVTDTFRKAGEKLVDYRILGEVPSERKRCMAAELRFEPERAERTRFLVVGIDPLWVFRQEDAENLAHWEHHEEKSTPSPKEATEARP